MMTESHNKTPHHTTPYHTIPYHTISNQSQEHMQDASNDNVMSFKVGKIQSKSLISHSCLVIIIKSFSHPT